MWLLCYVYMWNFEPVIIQSMIFLWCVTARTVMLKARLLVGSILPVFSALKCRWYALLLAHSVNTQLALCGA
jgi:hypothetical protein